MFMGTSLRIVSLLVFFLGAHLIIPEIAIATGTFNSLTTNVFSAAPNVSSQSLKKISFTDESNSKFVPPDYSGPDSTHGSGTR